MSARRTPICSGFVAIFTIATLGAAPQDNPLPPEPTPILPAEVAWSYELESPPSGAAVMDADRVYVPTEEGNVHAFTRETGQLVWTETGATRWAPVVSDGRVLLALSDGIRVLDAATGAPLWNFSLGQAVSAAPVAHGSLLFVPTEPGEIVALDVAKGALAWRQSLGARSRHPVAVLEQNVIASLADGRVVALALRSGEVLWERRLPETLSAPGTARNRVLVGSTNNFFYALNAENGKEAWRWRTGGDVMGGAGTDERVYFVALDNILRGVNRDNGNQDWKVAVRTRAAAPPVVVGDVVVVVGVAPRIDAFAGETGDAVGTYTAPTDLQGVPAIDADLQPFKVAMIILTRDARVTALRPTRMMLPDPPLVPLQALPGRELPPERLPPATPERRPTNLGTRDD